MSSIGIGVGLVIHRHALPGGKLDVQIAAVSRA